jgi:hypothetical protein
MKPETKFSLLQKHLIAGGRITSIEAIDRWRMTRLAAYICKLIRRGWKIDKQDHPCPGSYYTEYWLNVDNFPAKQ